MGFSHSDPTIYIEAAYTGRLAADAGGYMDPPMTLKVGEDEYVKHFSMRMYNGKLQH